MVSGSHITIQVPTPRIKILPHSITQKIALLPTKIRPRKPLALTTILPPIPLFIIPHNLKTPRAAQPVIPPLHINLLIKQTPLLTIQPLIAPLTHLPIVPPTHLSIRQLTPQAQVEECCKPLTQPPLTKPILLFHLTLLLPIRQTPLTLLRQILRKLTPHRQTLQQQILHRQTLLRLIQPPQTPLRLIPLRLTIHRQIKRIPPLITQRILLVMQTLLTLPTLHQVLILQMIKLKFQLGLTMGVTSHTTLS